MCTEKLFLNQKICKNKLNSIQNDNKSGSLPMMSTPEMVDSADASHFVWQKCYNGGHF